MLIKKIIVDEVYLSKFARTVYENNNEIDIPYKAGKFQNLIPKELENKGNLSVIERHYINESFLFNEIIDVGNKGLYYFVLEKDYKIDQLLFQPDELIVDLFIHKKGRLIYSFYNPTRKEIINLRGKISLDYDKIYEKLKSNIQDVYWRSYFIKLATKNIGNEVRIRDYFPQNMNIDQTASYLNVSKKTLYKWNSEDPTFPVTKLNGKVIYSKEKIDKWVETKTTKNNKRGKKQLFFI